MAFDRVDRLTNPEFGRLELEDSAGFVFRESGDNLIFESSEPFTYSEKDFFSNTIFVPIDSTFNVVFNEAMSVETPVITSRLTSLPEVGGDAVLYIDPDDPGPIVNLFDRLLDDDYCLGAGRLGLERARQFTWERSAQKTLEVISRVGSVTG